MFLRVGVFKGKMAYVLKTKNVLKCLRLLTFLSRCSTSRFESSNRSGGQAMDFLAFTFPSLLTEQEGGWGGVRLAAWKENVFLSAVIKVITKLPD